MNLVMASSTGLIFGEYLEEVFTLEFLYKNILSNSRTRSYFSSFFTKKPENTVHETLQIQETFKCQTFKRNRYSYNAIPLWNQIPSEIKLTCNFQLFKMPLRAHFLLKRSDEYLLLMRCCHSITVTIIMYRIHDIII